MVLTCGWDHSRNETTSPTSARDRGVQLTSITNAGTALDYPRSRTPSRVLHPAPPIRSAAPPIRSAEVRGTTFGAWHSTRVARGRSGNTPPHNGSKSLPGKHFNSSRRRSVILEIAPEPRPVDQKLVWCDRGEWRIGRL